MQKSQNKSPLDLSEASNSPVCTIPHFSFSILSLSLRNEIPQKWQNEDKTTSFCRFISINHYCDTYVFIVTEIYLLSNFIINIFLELWNWFMNNYVMQLKPFIHTAPLMFYFTNYWRKQTSWNPCKHKLHSNHIFQIAKDSQQHKCCLNHKPMEAYLENSFPFFYCGWHQRACTNGNARLKDEISRACNKPKIQFFDFLFMLVPSILKWSTVLVFLTIGLDKHFWRYFNSALNFVCEHFRMDKCL